jgi:hypothetical protein
MINQAFSIIRSLTVALGLMFLLCSVDASYAQLVSFFPKRPPGVTVKHMQGILTNFGFGNASGNVSVINDQGKEVDFYTSWPMLIDGHQVICAIAPTDTFKAHPQNCPDWPADIRLGHTKVEVTYWSSTRDGEPVLVSDEIKRVP